MPRRSILSASERDGLLALPDSRDDLIRRYTLSEHDLSIVRQRRGAANRLGFAVQLCYLRYPGIVLGVDQLPLPALLHLVASQLKIPVERWTEYGERAQTRREHLVELQTVFGFEPFTRGHHRLAVEDLKITPLDASVPQPAQSLIDQIAASLPHVKITELLLEVDQWTGFTKHFTHLKSGDAAKDRTPLLTTILADAINLESCPGSSYAKLSWLQAWHIRDETYAASLAELVNAQSRQPFAEHWGDGTTSSSDGQRFKVGGKAESTGHINPKYGAEPGKLFYTHISDQYAPFSSKVVNVGVRDSTYVLDGLLHHESDLRIEEHYTDTAGFTDHVFALMHLLGFRFAPRIRDLSDTKLYLPNSKTKYQTLAPMTGGTINLKAIRTHWDEILRLVLQL